MHVGLPFQRFADHYGVADRDRIADQQDAWQAFDVLNGIHRWIGFFLFLGCWCLGCRFGFDGDLLSIGQGPLFGFCLVGVGLGGENARQGEAQSQ